MATKPALAKAETKPVIKCKLCDRVHPSKFAAKRCIH